MRRAVLLGLALAAADIAVISGPLISRPAGPIVSGAAFVMMTVAIMLVAMSRRPWSVRLRPVGVAAIVVGAWLAFRTLVVHDQRVLWIALAVQGFLIVLVGGMALTSVLIDRGWIRYTATKRRIIYAAILASALLIVLSLIDLPPAPWNARLRLGITVLMVVAMFWPARRAPAERPVGA